MDEPTVNKVDQLLKNKSAISKVSIFSNAMSNDVKLLSHRYKEISAAEKYNINGLQIAFLFSVKTKKNDKDEF